MKLFECLERRLKPDCTNSHITVRCMSGELSKVTFSLMRLVEPSLYSYGKQRTATGEEMRVVESVNQAQPRPEQNYREQSVFNRELWYKFGTSPKWEKNIDYRRSFIDSFTLTLHILNIWYIPTLTQKVVRIITSAVTRSYILSQITLRMTNEIKIQIY